MSTVVELAQLLAAPVTGLLGVGLGYIGQSRSADKRLTAERETARESRLFDYRRVAYAEFLTTAQRSYDAALTERHDSYEPPLPEDAFVPLWEKSSEVAIYGTKEANDAAFEITELISSYGWGTVPMPQEVTARAVRQREIEDEIVQMLVAFREVVRKDLGVR